MYMCCVFFFFLKNKYRCETSATKSKIGAKVPIVTNHTTKLLPIYLVSQSHDDIAKVTETLVDGERFLQSLTLRARFLQPLTAGQINQVQDS